MRLTHPHFTDVHVDVPDRDVASWVAAGWLTPEPAPKTPATRRGRSSTTVSTLGRRNPPKEI